MTAVAAIGFVGCSREEDETERYQTFSGTVLHRWTDNGRMVILVGEPRGNKFAGRELECVVTSDSELYLNGTFCALAEITVDDRIDVIGYFSRDEKSHFWITSAFASRPEPEYPEPVIIQEKPQEAPEPAEE